MDTWSSNNNVVRAHRTVVSEELRRTKAENALTRTKVRDLIRKNAGPDELDDENVNLLAGGINYKSVRNTNKAFRKAVLWLKRKVGKAPYGVVLERFARAPKLPKSSHWLAHRLFQGIGRAPSAVCVSQRSILKAIKNGVRKFVHFDDASYSGSYFAEMVDMWIDVLGSLPSTTRSEVRFFLAAGAISDTARAKLQPRLRKSEGSVKLYAPLRMRSTRNFLSSVPANRRQRLTKYLTDGHVGENAAGVANLPFTVLAHKVPNEISFPRRVSRLLEPHVFSPYKAVGILPIPDTVFIDRKTGSHHHFFPQSDGSWEHVQYKIVRGTMKPVRVERADSPRVR